MADWRKQILDEFPSKIARLTLVADPDDLLTEEGILQKLEERGYEIIEYEDAVAFRYAYESKYRRQWDRGETTDLVVVLRSREDDLERLPYDLYQAGRKLAFSIPQIFPHLSYPVVKALDRVYYDRLYEAEESRKDATRYGDDQTCDFILAHVFETPIELITEPHHILQFLIRKHYRNLKIPKVLNDRFVRVVWRDGRFEDWPLSRIVADKSEFFAFLQERWRLFVDGAKKDSRTSSHEKGDGYSLKYPGPTRLPFEHDDVRVYMDNLFNEDILQPVEVQDADRIKVAWIQVGISKGTNEDYMRRFEHLMDSVTTPPGRNAHHEEWTRYACNLAEADALVYLNGESMGGLAGVREKMQPAFQEWMLGKYASLYNQPPDPPVMVHHIPRSIAARLAQDADARTALLVIDGLSLSQWVILKEVLKVQTGGMRFEEQSVFAWVPTLTSISRQAIFSGKIPLFFPESIRTTAKEPAKWRNFWEAKDLSPDSFQFFKKVSPDDMGAICGELENPDLRVLGLVVNTVDDIMHGMQLGMAGMFGQVQQWAQTGFLAELLSLLTDNGYSVLLTSDHGNTEAVGIGNPAEGDLAETRGQRLRTYSSDEMRRKIAEQYPEALVWPQVGLPNDIYPLIAPDGAAFIDKGKSAVSHGGTSIEEVIVPYIRISKVE